MITPKEKAKEYIETFEKVQIPYMDSMSGTIERSDMEHDNAKECALITVKEILKAREAGTTGVVFDKAFWEETESELNLL